MITKNHGEPNGADWEILHFSKCRETCFSGRYMCMRVCVKIWFVLHHAVALCGNLSLLLPSSDKLKCQTMFISLSQTASTQQCICPYAIPLTWEGIHTTKSHTIHENGFVGSITAHCAWLNCSLGTRAWRKTCKKVANLQVKWSGSRTLIVTTCFQNIPLVYFLLSALPLTSLPLFERLLCETAWDSVELHISKDVSVKETTTLLWHGKDRNGGLPKLMPGEGSSGDAQI